MSSCSSGSHCRSSLPPPPPRRTHTHTFPCPMHKFASPSRYVYPLSSMTASCELTADPPAAEGSPATGKRQAHKPHLLPKLVMYTTAGVLFLKSWMVLVSSAVNARCACATSPGPVQSTCCPRGWPPLPTVLPGLSHTRRASFIISGRLDAASLV